MSDPIDSTLKDRRAVRTLATLPLLLPEVRGSNAAWAGVQTVEPMQRGCDQRGMMDRLAAKGVRHLVVPLNGPSEDSCLFARKHIIESGGAGGALYDLERRDEGAFTRLKFLLEAAASSGLMIGLSLFDASSGDAAGPFRKGGNIQGLSVSAASTGQADECLLATLSTVADWVCSAARGFRGLWIEIFRNASGAPSALERVLCARVAETLARHGEDLSPARLGPWIAARRSDVLREKHAAQAAPFDTSREFLADASLDFSEALWRAESAAGASDAEFLFSRAPRRQPALLRFAESALDSARSDWLWRAFFRGYWPVVDLRVEGARDARLLETVAAIARFGVAWAGRGALRPCPEILAPMRQDAVHFAAEDGTGRFFAYFGEPAAFGLALALPPGFYRFYWIDPAAGRIVDQGEGAEGGPRTGIPGCADSNAKLLVLEQDESPDPMSIW